MTLNLEHAEVLLESASQAALAAGKLIQTQVKEALRIETKEAGNSIASQIVTDLDRRCDTLIADQLQSSLTSFDFGWLSEEREDDFSRLDKDYFWCVDPLDGTLAFTQGIPGYAVSIALVSRAGVPEMGVVYDPFNKTLYQAAKAKGMLKNKRPWQPPIQQSGNVFTLFCDASFTSQARFPGFLETFEAWAATQAYSEVRIETGGGAVMNALNALDLASAAYIKPPRPERGGGSLWDFAASACFFDEAKACATDFFGAALKLNRQDDLFMNKEGVAYTHTPEIRQALNAAWQNST